MEEIPDALTPWMAVGFLFAGYAVIANDSVQTVHGSHLPMRDLVGKLCGSGASVSFIIWYGWYMNGGDTMDD